MKPTKDQLKQMIAEYYSIKGNYCGGSLHIVLDDGNIESHFIQWCLEYAEDRGDAKGVELANMLLMFEEDEPAEVLEIYPDWEDSYE